MKNFLLGVFTTLAVLATDTFCYLLLGFAEVRGDHPGSALETRLMRAAVHASVRRHAPEMPNPVAPTDDNLIAAIKVYGQHYAICHGTAKGDPSASPVAKGLYPRPPQLATDGLEDDPEGFSYWKIKHGIRWTGMPSWKGTLTDQQIWNLALFLKHMDKLPPAAEQAWQNVVN